MGINYLRTGPILTTPGGWGLRNPEPKGPGQRRLFLSQCRTAGGGRRRVVGLWHRFPAGPRRVLGVPPRLGSADLSYRKRSAARTQAGHLQRDFGERIDPAPRPRARPRAAGNRPQAGAGLAPTMSSFRTSAQRWIGNPEVRETQLVAGHSGFALRAPRNVEAKTAALASRPQAAYPPPRQARAASSRCQASGRT